MRSFLSFQWLSMLLGLVVGVGSAEASEPPNVVLIVCDDLGYADLGCFGSKSNVTPHLDRMATEGIRLMDFYVSSAVCSASRAALLTGAYHERVGIRGALGPRDLKGLNHAETTIAELLKGRGYATGMAGKWHLGSRSSQLPIHHGFDEYLGLPYSNDMWPSHPDSASSYPPLPLVEGDKTLISPVTAEIQKTLTSRYTDRAVDFIRRNQARPFFFYLAFSMPHVPLHASASFEGSTRRGLYADVVSELDASVGRVLQVIKDLGIDEKTIVMFTSDNGPWLSYGDHAGSAGPLREGKGTSFEGGIRVPMIARWPGHLPAGATCREPAATIDILSTIAAITESRLPERPIDGKDISMLLKGDPLACSPHDALFFYYGNGQLQAMRSGRWKLIFPHRSQTMNGQPAGHGGVPGRYRPLQVELELHDLENDVGETRNLAAARPDIVRELAHKAEAIRQELGDQLTQRVGTAVRPAETADK